MHLIDEEDDVYVDIPSLEIPFPSHPPRPRTKRRERISSQTRLLIVLRLIELARYSFDPRESLRLGASFPELIRAANDIAPGFFNRFEWENQDDVLNGAECAGCGKSLADDDCADSYGHTDHTAEECAWENLAKCKECNQRHCPKCKHGCLCEKNPDITTQFIKSARRHLKIAA